MKNLKMLAIDLGASSGRGIVGSFDGERLTLEENHRFTNDPVMVSGRFNWDILRIFHEIKTSIRKSVLNGDNVKSMGIDTWGVDYGLIDKNGHLIGNPTHYRDIRTEDIADFCEKYVKINEIYNTTGIQTMDYNTILQLAAELKYNPEIFEYADKLLFIPDLLGYFLTGKTETEYTVASTGAILDAVTREYAWNLIDKLGIKRSLFTKIVKPKHNSGKLLPQILEEVGQTELEVIKVAAHDTASAVLAVPSDKEDFVYISSGTWSLMGTELNEPLINCDTERLNYTNEGGAENTIRFLKNIMGLWIFNESRRQWIREGKEYSFAELTEMALKVKPYRSIVNPDDKIFSVPGNMPERIREYCKKTSQYVPETEGEIVRVIFDSLALRYRATVENIAELTGRKAEAVNIVGGGAQNRLLCQLTSDVCGLDVVAGPVEATAIGNICVQAMAAGEISNMNEARQVVARSFNVEYYNPNAEMRGVADDAYGRFSELTR